MNDIVKRPTMNFLNHVLNVHVIIDVISKLFLLYSLFLTQWVSSLLLCYYLAVSTTLGGAIIPVD